MATLKTVDVTLSVGERLILLSLLPQRGNIFTLKELRVAQEEVGFSGDEQTAIGLTVANGQATWKPGAADKAVTFTSFIFDLIRQLLKEKDEKKELEAAHITLYDKFVVVEVAA